MMRIRRSSLLIVSLLGLLLVWQGLIWLTDLPDFILPSPMAVWARFAQLVRSGSLLRHFLTTLKEVLLGLALGASVAMTLGYLLAKSPLVERLLAPYIVASQSVPTVAIAPLLVIWFGPGLLSKVLIAALIVFFPVLVNTVVLVRGSLGLPESALAWTMFAFGAGSMLAALILPRILDRIADRPVMLAGAVLMVATLLGLAASVSLSGLVWPLLLGAWLLVGLGYSAVLTPSGRLLRRSSQPEDRPAVFAAQFALSHACWLMTYPLSGWLLTQFGAVAALVVLAGLAALGAAVELRIWPKDDPEVMEHTHENLPLDHPHLKGHRRHAHTFVVDDQHPRWASQL